VYGEVLIFVVHGPNRLVACNNVPDDHVNTRLAPERGKDNLIYYTFHLSLDAAFTVTNASASSRVNRGHAETLVTGIEAFHPLK
jgi:hypothetical protein